jgi:hypothetical protein
MLNIQLGARSVVAASFDGSGSSILMVDTALIAIFVNGASAVTV